MTHDFTSPIRRALNRVCTADLLGLHSSGFHSTDFSAQAKIRLIQRQESVTALARRIGFPRNSVSLAIHGRRRMPRIERAVRKELGL